MKTWVAATVPDFVEASGLFEQANWTIKPYRVPWGYRRSVVQLYLMFQWCPTTTGLLAAWFFIPSRYKLTIIHHIITYTFVQNRK
jgi:hypothetical protein